MSRHGRQKSVSLELTPERNSRSDQVARILQNAAGLQRAWDIACQRCNLVGLSATKHPFVFLSWRNAPIELRTWSLQLARTIAQKHGGLLKPLSPAQIVSLHEQFRDTSVASTKVQPPSQLARTEPRISVEQLALLHGGLDEGDPLFALAQAAYAGQLHL